MIVKYEEIDYLIKYGNSEEAYQLLLDIKKTKELSVDEMGWMYWNLSDIPAVMRKPHVVYKNHVEFVEWGKKALFPHKLHWIVSDATQALTLSLGDNFEKWMRWYLFACEHSSKTERNRGVRFESHRAAVASLLILERFYEIEVPLTNMLNVISEDEKWENNIFVEFTYYTLLAEKAFHLNQADLLKDAEKNIVILTDKVKEVIYTVSDNKENTLLGSWESLNYTRLTKESMSVLLHNGACTLHKIGKHVESIETFQLALQHGVNITAYGLALYLSSLWKVNKNNTKVLEAFDTYSPEGLTVKELFQFASDLREIDWDNSAKER